MFYRHADTMQHSAQKLSGFMCPRAIVARNIAEESTSTPVSLLFFIRSSYIYGLYHIHNSSAPVTLRAGHLYRVPATCAQERVATLNF